VEIFGGLELFAAGRIPNGAPVQNRMASHAGLRRAPLLGVTDLPARVGAF
jgi:hypothetical protein